MVRGKFYANSKYSQQMHQKQQSAR